MRKLKKLMSMIFLYTAYNYIIYFYNMLYELCVRCKIHIILNIFVLNSRFINNIFLFDMILKYLNYIITISFYLLMLKILNN